MCVDKAELELWHSEILNIKEFLYILKLGVTFQKIKGCLESDYPESHNVYSYDFILQVLEIMMYCRKASDFKQPML